MYKKSFWGVFSGIKNYSGGSLPPYITITILKELLLSNKIQQYLQLLRNKITTSVMHTIGINQKNNIVILKVYSC